MLNKVLVLRQAALRSQITRSFHAPSRASYVTVKEADKILYENFKEHEGASTCESDVHIAKNNARIFATNWMVAAFASVGLGFFLFFKLKPHDTLEKNIKRHEH